MLRLYVLLLLATLRNAFGSPDLQARQGPTVILDSATVAGIGNGTVNAWLGIPFAQPPVGNLRFQLPQALPPYTTSFSATAFGQACPQQLFQLTLPAGFPADAANNLSSLFYNLAVPSGEDCLTVNVFTPYNSYPGANLPVVVWIYGGGFEFGASSTYDGSVIVNKGISLGVPCIYVSMNYRLNAFGFLASEEVKAAGVGNLGLQDQRQALRWVQKYITAFGGDPTRVTLWGESAGAISTSLHMLTNGGNTQGLFRAAFMESGSPLPVGDITHGQPYYDALVQQTGCTGATDTLQCLRGVPYNTLLNAMKQSPTITAYQSLVLAWLPRVDGVFLTADPQLMVQQGGLAQIPFVTGDCDDEGTMFSLSNLNVTTDAEFAAYLQQFWFPNAPSTVVQQIMQYYPNDPTQGSPFGTGTADQLSPEFKRFAAFQGDIVFQAPRRLMLQSQSGKQSVWTYLSTRLKAVPYLGSFHATDLLNVYGGEDLAAYLVRFATYLDPNVGTRADIYWPQYTTQYPNMLMFMDASPYQALTQDTYRAAPIAYLMNVSLTYPL